MKNLPSLKDIAENPAVLKGLSLETLDVLLFSAEGENKMISACKRAICGHIEAEYAASIAAAYAASQKDFGTVRIDDGAYDVVIDTPKRVEWDGSKLAAIEAAIRDSGDSPAEYITIERRVDERKYAAWPAHIRATFEEARTVKPGSRTVKLVRKEAA
jgi:hypothetical protein